jgi:type II secretory pathway component GspD/PulD (secretin)
MNRFKRKKIKSLIARGGLAGLLVSSLTFPLKTQGEEVFDFSEQNIVDTEGYCINFHDVPIIEFVRFVSKISEENFIYNSKELNFNVSLSTGKSVTTAQVVQALIQLLRIHGFAASHDAGYFVIRKSTDAGPVDFSGKSFEGLIASNGSGLVAGTSEKYEFFVHKLQYHEGQHIVDTLKKIAADLRSQPDAPGRLINAIQSLQYVQATNSLLCSTDPDTLGKLRTLIEDLDKPLRQVFIEVLVVETDVKKSMEFGLQWAAGGQFQNKVGFGLGNFAPGSSFAGAMKGINPQNPPTGLDQIPLVPGFDLGVIGNVIMHKGKSYLSLGSLVSALQLDGSSTIVLNQKIITQDNKNSTIFNGENIPFTGSVVSTVGQSQQTSANIEYRDVGVSLSITPRLGEGDIITLEINEQITETLDQDMMASSNTTVNGIRTTKTNMATHVHVPDKNFLVLSGMIRNTKANRKAGIPCLGGLPIIGLAFSKTKKDDEKRNVIIFVRPHIIRSFEDYDRLTKNQAEIYRNQAEGTDFSEALQLVPHENEEK